MGSKIRDELVGLRVVRGPNWEWETQDGGDGFAGTVIGVVGNARNPRYIQFNYLKTQLNHLSVFVVGT